MVSQVTHSKKVHVELLDKHIVIADQADVISVGGAEPCPALSLEDAVLVRVRSHHGPHPNSPGESCDYYIPGIVRSIPEDNRKGRASYSVIVFNGKAVNCPRRAMIKIGVSKYVALSKHIKEKLSLKSKDNASDSSTSCSTATLSQISLGTRPFSRNSFSSNRTQSIRSKSSTNSTLNSDHKSQSLKGSRTRSQTSQSTQMSLSVKVTSARQRRSSGSTESVLDLKQLKKLNRAQEALLAQQSKELSAMQASNAMLEIELQRRMEEFKKRKSFSSKGSINSGSHKKKDANNETDDHNERAKLEPHPNKSEEVTDGLFPSVAPSSSWIAAYLSPLPNQHLTNDISAQNNRLQFSDQAVNTDVWTEDKGVGTGPLMESKAVVTEWSESGLDSSSDTLTQHTETPPPRKATPINYSQPSSPIPPRTPSSITVPDDIVPGHLHYEEEDMTDPLVDEHVLARWPDDGWYYRGVIKQALGSMSYEVEDATQDSEVIHARDIIIDAQDASHPVQKDQTVAALHPKYCYSYAPGTVRGVVNDGLHFTVELYDGTHALLPRHDLYYLEPSKHSEDVLYLQQREAMWPGKAVIARRDRDGYYLPGKWRQATYYTACM